MNSKYNIGLVGYGYIGEHHCKAILKLKKFFNLKVIFEKNKNFAKLKKFSKKIEIKKNFDKNNIPPGLDIIVITAPSHLHVKFANIAINHAKIVIIEKPLSLNLNEAVKLIKNIKRKRKKIVVVKQLRLNPVYRHLKKLFDNNAFGKLHFISFDIFLNRSKEYFSSSNWKGKLKLDGGTLFNQISHFVDLLFWFFGDIDQASGFKISKNKIYNEDSGQVSIFFKKKIFVSLNYSIKSFKKNFKNQINIISEKCNLEATNNKLNKISIDDKRLTNNINEINKKIDREIKQFGKGFEKFYTEVYQTMKNNKNTNLSINQNALKSFKNLYNVSKKMKVISNV